MDYTDLCPSAFVRVPLATRSISRTVGFTYVHMQSPEKQDDTAKKILSAAVDFFKTVMQ